MIKTGLLKRDLPNVKTITQAGGKLNAALKRRLLDYCEQSKKKLYVMYGQTEATARMSYVPPHKLRDKIDSIGISVSGGALEVLSDVGVALSPHERGEIVYTGPNVSLGYAEKISDLNLDDTLDGKLYTGDVGYRDEDGFFFVVGRNKRFAKVFGLRLSLDELEDLLVYSFPHLDFMCKDNEGTIEILFSGGDLDINDATKIVSNSTKIHRSAFKFEKISHVPRNDRGKKVYGD
jgi:acyl-coenzyme A synthetase/AMP-(fatty) acid ligase